MSHEYGHYMFCDMLQGWNGKAVGHLAWSTIHAGDDLSQPTRYLNEAMADYFMGQVAGALDYGWLRDRKNASGDSRPQEPSEPKLPLPFGKTPEQIEHDLNIYRAELAQYQSDFDVWKEDIERWEDEDDHEPDDYCIDPISPSPVGDDCWEQNINLTATDSDSSRSIGRIATMLMDAFDGHGAPRGALLPNDGDAWDYSSRGPDLKYGHLEGKLPLVFSPYGYLNRDSHLERVALDGGNPWRVFAREIARDLKAYAQEDGGITDQKIYGALDFAMSDAGVDWCDRCRVLALHAPNRIGTSVRDLLQTCQEDTELLAQVMSAPPSPAESIDADTCLPCPADQAPRRDGSCGGECTVDVTIEAADLPWDRALSLVASDAYANDACPQTLVVEITNFIDIDSEIESLWGSVAGSECATSHSLNMSQFDASGASVSSQFATAVGVYSQSCDTGPSPICLESCDGLPSFSVSSTSWPTGVLRFETPADPGKILEIYADAEDPIQR